MTTADEDRGYINLRVPWPEGKVPTADEHKELVIGLTEALDACLRIEALKASLEPCEECDDV